MAVNHLHLMLQISQWIKFIHFVNLNIGYKKSTARVDFYWSGRQDLNLQHLVPKTSALPG